MPHNATVTPRSRNKVGRARRELDLKRYSHRFAARLRELREAQGLTVDRFADKVGVTDKRVYAWESGMNMPHLDLLPAVAKALKCPITALMPPK